LNNFLAVGAFALLHSCAMSYYSFLSFFIAGCLNSIQKRKCHLRHVSNTEMLLNNMTFIDNLRQNYFKKKI